MGIRRNLVPGAPEIRGHRRSLFRVRSQRSFSPISPPTSSSSSMPPAGPRSPPPAWDRLDGLWLDPLLAIRKDGFHMTCGEAYSGICGIAASSKPI